MSLSVIMPNKVFKQCFYDTVPNKEILMATLSNAPTVKAEYGAPMPLDPSTYELARSNDEIALKRIKNYLSIDETRVCCELRDLIFKDGEVLGEIVFAGPMRTEFEELYKDGRFDFIPRYYFDQQGNCRIYTWDVVIA